MRDNMSARFIGGFCAWADERPSLHCLTQGWPETALRCTILFVFLESDPVNGLIHRENHPASAFCFSVGNEESPCHSVCEFPSRRVTRRQHSSASPCFCSWVEPSCCRKRRSKMTTAWPSMTSKP